MFKSVSTAYVWLHLSHSIWRPISNKPLKLWRSFLPSQNKTFIQYLINCFYAKPGFREASFKVKHVFFKDYLNLLSSSRDWQTCNLFCLQLTGVASEYPAEFKINRYRDREEIFWGTFQQFADDRYWTMQMQEKGVTRNRSRPWGVGIINQPYPRSFCSALLHLRDLRLVRFRVFLQ